VFCLLHLITCETWVSDAGIQWVIIYADEDALYTDLTSANQMQLQHTGAACWYPRAALVQKTHI
jgi:hypothetical protein